MRVIVMRHGMSTTMTGQATGMLKIDNEDLILTKIGENDE